MLDTEYPDRRAIYLVILLFGFVSLFGDIIYEGARSVTGPYLSLLGGTALVVGVVAGLGEFLGYALRLVSGHLADIT
ncbi:MAG: MFS transporter, partial [Methanomicrobiaceae archaeon]|nr:MFS transporter [Methanomicrobiaceae archaeon]